MTTLSRTDHWLGTIEMDAATQDKLRSLMMSRLSPHACDASGAASQKDVDLCVSSSSIKRDLDRVFKDGRLDFLEAPIFFRVARYMAGTDRYLEASKVSLSNYQKAVVFEALNQDIRRPGIAKPQKKHDVISITDDRDSNELFDKYEKRLAVRHRASLYSSTFFQPDTGFQKTAAQNLAELQTNLDRLIDFTNDTQEPPSDNQLNRLYLFSDMTNMSNLFGLLYALGSPKDFLSHDAAHDFSKRLAQLQKGVDILLKGLNNNQLPLHDSAVRDLLNSPISDFARLKQNYQGKKPTGDVTELEQRGKHLMQELSKIAHKSDFKPLAKGPARYSVFMNGQDFPAFVARDPKMELNLKWINAKSHQVLDQLVSLPSLMFMAGGSIMGYILAKTKTAAHFSLWFSQTSPILKGLSRLLPGMTLMRHKALQGFVSLAFELGLSFAFTALGKEMAGDKGAKWGAWLSLFTGGLLSSARFGIRAQLASDVLTSKANPLLKKFLSQKPSSNEINQLAKRLSPYTRPHLFAKPIPSGEITHKLRLTKEAWNRYAREQAQAIREEQAAHIASAARLATVKPRRKPKPKKTDRSPEPKKAKKKKVKAPNPEPRTLTPTQIQIAAPETTVCRRTISQATSQQVSLSPQIEAALADVYAQRSRFRSPFWQRVEDLERGRVSNGSWTQTDGELIGKVWAGYQLKAHPKSGGGYVISGLSKT